MTAIATDDTHSYAVTRDDSVVAWGLDEAGQTGNPTTLTGVTAIAAGGDDVVAIVKTPQTITYAPPSAAPALASTKTGTKKR